MAAASFPAVCQVSTVTAADFPPQCPYNLPPSSKVQTLWRRNFLEILESNFLRIPWSPSLGHSNVSVTTGMLIRVALHASAKSFIINERNRTVAHPRLRPLLVIRRPRFHNRGVPSQLLIAALRFANRRCFLNQNAVACMAVCRASRSQFCSLVALTITQPFAAVCTPFAHKG